MLPMRGAREAAARVGTTSIVSEPFSQSRLNALRRQKRPVFVDATAAWCVTCLVNENIALDRLFVADQQQIVELGALEADRADQRGRADADARAPGQRL